MGVDRVQQNPHAVGLDPSSGLSSCWVLWAHTPLPHGL